MNDDYKDCPIGIKNIAEIEKTKDRFTLMIEHIEAKIDDMKEDIVSLNKKMDQKFQKIDERFDAIDKRFDDFEVSLPSKVDNEIENKLGKGNTKIIAWIIGTAAGIAVAVITGLIMRNLGL